MIEVTEVDDPNVHAKCRLPQGKQLHEFILHVNETHCENQIKVTKVSPRRCCVLNIGYQDLMDASLLAMDASFPFGAYTPRPVISFSLSH